MLRAGRSLAALLGLALAPAASAQMLDVDGLLTDASAVPLPGTVRVIGNGGGQSVSSESSGGTANVSGSLLWVPFRNLGGDLGAYYQTGRSGPAVRVRYQVLSQEWAPLNLSLGARYKSEGFAGQGHGEAEAILALGRSFGRLDLALNMVWGWEIDDPGQDAELKALIGWRFSDDLRLGLETRVQCEVHDEDGFKGPTLKGTDIIGGPVMFWRVARPVTLQVLVGVSKPATTTTAGVLALGGFSVDL